MYSLRIQIMFSVLSIFLPNSLFLSAFISFIHVGVFPEMSGDFDYLTLFMSEGLKGWVPTAWNTLLLCPLSFLSPAFSSSPFFSVSPLCFDWRESVLRYILQYIAYFYTRSVSYILHPVQEGMEESWRSRYLATEYIHIVSLGKSGKRWRKLNWVNQMKTWQKWKPTEDWEPDQLPRHLFLYS